MRAFRKKDFPVSGVRPFLEPGPIVLISSAWKGKTDIMTLGWHTVTEFTPSRVACCIAAKPARAAKAPKMCRSCGWHAA